MKIYIKNLIFAIILSLILIFGLSIIISQTSCSEKILKPSLILISAISNIIASFLVSKFKKKQGIINGAIISGLYILILFILSLCLNRGVSFNLNSLIMIIITIFSGIIGGILGINF